MTNSNYIGWDIGGAHLKVAGVSTDGKIEFVEQYATPLWQGIDKLSGVLSKIITGLPQDSSLHAVTMTAELVDIFENRNSGIKQLTELCQQYMGKDINLYASELGFVIPDSIKENADSIASANWHASACIAASMIKTGLFVDIGSTTTDIIPFQNGVLVNKGFDDQSRMRFDELVYTGIVRTPLMALTNKAPFDGHWQHIAAEYFATTADIYRILGVLNEEDDLMDSADGKAKDKKSSIKRLARMLGTDASVIQHEDNWRELAEYFAEKQMQLLSDAIQHVSSRINEREIKIVGAGAGRFLVKKMAERMGQPFIEFSELFSCQQELQHMCNVCAPAVALAQLNRIYIKQ